jgi:hypothetical protein
MDTPDEALEEVIEDEPVVDDEEATGAHTTLINPQGTFGIRFVDRYATALYERKQYTTEETVGVGENTRTYQPGEYGPWKRAAKPYQTEVEVGVLKVYEWMLQDGLAGHEDLRFIVDEIRRAKEEIITTIRETFPHLKPPERKKGKSKKK